METSQTEELEIKLEISAVGADLYVEQDGKFAINEIAEVLKMNVADIFDYFPNKSAILEFYYTSLVIRYQLMVAEIEDFETYTLSEKLSNFMYASLDLLNEKPEFVEMTFSSMIRRSYIKTPFEKETESVITAFFERDANISTSSSLFLNRLFYQLILQKYLYIISYWIKDESDNKEQTMEFIDKLTALIQEVMYNRVADRTFELVKFLFTNTTCSIPFWDKISSKIEIR